MIIKTAQFVMSNTDAKQCPKPNRPEYAFIGRSNVGKSSLINMLTNHSGLAKISSTPGKTRLINHFIINEQWYLVDLMGYGYSKISKDMRKSWNSTIENYLVKRDNLLCIFVLIDISIPTQAIDLEFMEYLISLQRAFIILFTKADKLTKNQLNISFESYKKLMLNDWEELPQMIITSVKSNAGRDEVLTFIESLCKKK